MAYDNRGTNLPGVVAAADLSALQHRFVTIGATGVNVTAAAGRIDAVLDNDPILNQAATLMGPGSVAKVTASAAITVGDSVGSAASGKARTALALDYIAGICVEAAGADGELCSVWLTFPAKV